MPDWYRVIESARYLKSVAPWDLAGVPESAGHPCWVAWAQAAQAIDAEVEWALRQNRANAAMGDGVDARAGSFG